jgi:hypothetical protein
MSFPGSRSLTASAWSLVAAVVVATVGFLPGPAHGRGGTGAGPQPRVDEFNGWFHDAGQLLLHTSNRGYFGRWGSDTGNPSAEWPAGSDHEYLWAAGLWVGGVVAEDTTTTAGVHEFGEFFNFEPEGCGQPPEGICVTFSGHPSGQRLVDDDGDGRVDEDPLDGEDNDHDGRFDEDFAAISDQMFRTVYYDSSTFFNQFRPDPADHHRPLGLEVTQESYVWTDPTIDDFVGVEYRIENTSSEIGGIEWDIDRVYLGLYTDADVGRDVDSWSPWADDQSAYVEVDTIITIGPGGAIPVSIRMAYTHDQPGNVDDVPGYLGAMLLGHTVDTTSSDPGSSFAPAEVGVHAFRRWPAGGADPGDDVERFLTLRGSSDDERTIDPPTIQPNDYRNLLSVGPFRLPACSTIVLQMAFVSGVMIEVPDPGGGTRRVPDLTNALHVQRLFDGYVDSESGESIRWVANSAPISARGALIPGNGRATILWDDSSESFADPITGELDFAGYRLERAGPFSSADPPPEEAWHVVASWDTASIAGIDTGRPGIARYEYVDSGLRNFQTYWYRVRSWDRGELASVVIWGDEIRVKPVPARGIAPEPIRVVTPPHASSVRFTNLPASSEIRIYTVRGRHVTTIRSGRADGALGEATWEPAASAGSGVYFYHVSSPDSRSRSGKVVVLR